MADKAKRAALIGYDCLIPKRLEAMLAQGGLEHFRAFMNEGSFIPEGYNLPTVTPPSWATICTGAYPRTHGVEDYYFYHEGRSLDYKETTQAFGSDIVTAETIWDAWDKNGKKCIVVNYPMSWPSRMKNGVIFSLDPSWSRKENRLPAPGPGWEILPKRMEVNFSIVGTDGVIQADCFGPNVYFNGGPNNRYTVQYTYFDEWIGMMDEFHDCILNHKQPKINLQWHRQTVEAMVRCYDSIASGEPVYMNK